MNVRDRMGLTEQPGMVKAGDRRRTHGSGKKKPVSQGSQSKEESSKKYTDVAELSEEGKALIKAFQEMREKLKQKMKMETEKSQKKKKNSYGALARALAIARLIMKGEQVSPEDENFLFHYNSDLYLKVKMMAMQNVEPKEHKSLLEKLKKDDDGGSISIPSVQISIEGSGDSSEGPDGGETEE